jgi:hypothetical protein
MPELPLARSGLALHIAAGKFAARTYLKHQAALRANTKVWTWFLFSRFAPILVA